MSGSFTLDLRMAPAVAYAIGTGAQVGYTVHTISSTARFPRRWWLAVAANET
jgi:hypothetical protein